MSRFSLFWTLLACAALAAVTAAADLADDKPAANESAKQFHEQLLDIAKSYKQVGPVDFEARWAPGLCRAPTPGMDYTPAKARLSDSKDSDTHGRKLYFLFAKDRHAYLGQPQEKTAKETRLGDMARAQSIGWKPLPEKLQALQQFVVKESWTPLEVDKDRREEVRPRQYIDPYASRDGKTYKTDKQSHLYIMFKLDEKTAATDNGWVYGTVTADGAKVTSAGRVESCMGCHKDAKQGRLFGLASEKTEKEKK